MLVKLSNTIAGLIDAATQLEADAPTRQDIEAIIEHGEFRPAEDEAIGFWFARFLTVRDNLWHVINNVQVCLHKPASQVESEEDLSYFLIGYAAVCLLVRIDRILLFEVAEHSLVQRKLNEAFPEYRIPRKQFTTIFSAFVDQANVLAIRDAMQVARKKRRQLLRLRNDTQVGFLARQLRDLESSLNPSKRRHFKRAWAYVSHKWRRRGVVSAERLFAKVLEGFGRAASEMADMKNKQVTADIRNEIGAFLQPGDVIVTRHAKALTNLFFPGYWPHVALYVGSPEQRDAIELDVDADRRSRWIDDICVLEAKKDGVLLRPLSDTLIVDAFTVLRPKLSPENVCHGLERALLHEGKQYNFDFNFFTSDRIVCTELIYRAYDGLEELEFSLHERAGRKTLSAEDLLDFALDTGAFTPVAIYGSPGCEEQVLYGDAVRDELMASYR